MKEIELVIFDMDGLMFDTEVVAKRAWRETAKANNYNITHEFFLTLIGRNKKAVEMEFKKLFGEEFPFDDIYVQQGKQASSIIENEGLKIKEGLIELLSVLKEKKVKIAVATSTSRDRTNKLLSLAGISEKFDKILCGDEVTNGKPDPEIFLTVCKKLNVSPEKALVLEDSEKGVEAAAAGKIKCIVVPDLIEPSEKHVKLAHSKVKSLKEVVNMFNS